MEITQTFWANMDLFLLFKKYNLVGEWWLRTNKGAILYWPSVFTVAYHLPWLSMSWLQIYWQINAWKQWKMSTNFSMRMFPPLNLPVFLQGHFLIPDLGQLPHCPLWHIFSHRWFPQDRRLPHICCFFNTISTSKKLLLKTSKLNNKMVTKQ